MKKAHSLSIAKAAHAYRKGNLRVRAGDYIGVIDGEIVSAEKKLEDTFEKTLQYVAKMTEINVITLFTGDQMEDSTKEALRTIVENTDSFIELYMLEGGQHLYDVLACVE